MVKIHHHVHLIFKNNDDDQDFTPANNTKFPSLKIHQADFFNF